MGKIDEIDGKLRIGLEIPGKRRRILQWLHGKREHHVVKGFGDAHFPKSSSSAARTALNALSRRFRTVFSEQARTLTIVTASGSLDPIWMSLNSSTMTLRWSSGSESIAAANRFR